VADFKVTNASGVIRSLTLQVDKAERAAVFAIARVGYEVEREAKLNATQGGTHPRGAKTGAIPGSGPARVTGALQRSIHTEISRNGFGNYVASVGPSMIYARAVELGHPKWSSGINYPYLVPAANKVRPRAQEIFIREFKKRIGV
jgi:hypothetical protein